MVFIDIKMDQNTMDYGKMIYKMVREWRFGMMDQNIEEIILKVKKKDLVDMNGQMDHIMKENGKIIRLMDLVHIVGLMVEDIQDNG